MDINHEAIYASHPWLAIKENSTGKTDNISIEESKNAIKDAVFDGTPKSLTPDVYYTAKDKAVYAFLRSWQKPDVLLKQINKSTLSIKNIELLGNNKKIKWVINNEGLSLDLPSDYNKGNQIPVYVLKITAN